jgi:GTPase SAR1 family protein
MQTLKTFESYFFAEPLEMTSRKYFSSDNTGAMMADSDEAVNCKILLLGDYAVGKTSLIQRFVCTSECAYHSRFSLCNLTSSYVDGVFPIDYKVTIGVDFAIKTITWQNRRVSLQFWDVAGMLSTRQAFSLKRNLQSTFYIGLFFLNEKHFMTE